MVSTIDFLPSYVFKALSSFEANWGPINERLDEPDVDVVESEEDDGCDGWPSLAPDKCCNP